MSTQVTISFDAMGGDYAPREIVKGAVLACQEFSIKALLVGKKEDIGKELAKHDTTGLDIEIFHADEEIDMGEKNPARAVRAAKNSSIMMANRLVAEGKADAVVAAGHTGAASASALFEQKRIPGFERPCIVCFIPTIASKMLLIDAGSNIESNLNQMVQNAIIGDIMARGLMNIEKPRVGLLNIGGEAAKGTELYKETYEELKKLSDQGKINFIGNVEGKTIIKGVCDVAIADGFAGNIHLKALEGGLRMFEELLRYEIKKSFFNTIAGMILKATGVFERIKKHFHPSSYGGALLGGINGVTIIAHGGSNAEAIKNSAQLAITAVESRIIDKVRESL